MDGVTQVGRNDTLDPCHRLILADRWDATATPKSFDANEMLMSEQWRAQ